jgi:hypothetical protein
MSLSTARRGMRMRLPIRNTGSGNVPALSARYNVERVSPSRIAVSSTLRSGREDFGKELLRMDVHRSCCMPGRVPWSQHILQTDVTPNVILDNWTSSAPGVGIARHSAALDVTLPLPPPSRRPFLQARERHPGADERHPGADERHPPRCRPTIRGPVRVPAPSCYARAVPSWASGVMGPSEAPAPWWSSTPLRRCPRPHLRSPLLARPEPPGDLERPG